MVSYFDIETKGEETWIVDNTACHIDGEPFKYKQVDKCRTEMLCKTLNELKQDSFELAHIMNIIHNIRYGNWEWQDLLDYLSGTSLDDLWAKHDDLSRMIQENE